MSCIGCDRTTKALEYCTDVEDEFTLDISKQDKLITFTNIEVYFSKLPYEVYYPICTNCSDKVLLYFDTNIFPIKNIFYEHSFTRSCSRYPNFSKMGIDCTSNNGTPNNDIIKIDLECKKESLIFGEPKESYAINFLNYFFSTIERWNSFYNSVKSVDKIHESIKGLEYIDEKTIEAICSISGQISDLDKKINEVDKRVLISDNIGGLRTSLNITNTKVDAIHNITQMNKYYIDEMKNKDTSTSNKLDNLCTSIDSINKDINNELSEHTSSITNLKVDVRSMSRKLDDLEQNVKDFNRYMKTTIKISDDIDYIVELKNELQDSIKLCKLIREDREKERKSNNKKGRNCRYVCGEIAAYTMITFITIVVLYFLSQPVSISF